MTVMKHKISRGVLAAGEDEAYLKGDIVHYSETVLVETSNILLAVSLSVRSNCNCLVTAPSD